jgi:hypothetical protein
VTGGPRMHFFFLFFFNIYIFFWKGIVGLIRIWIDLVSCALFVHGIWKERVSTNEYK